MQHVGSLVVACRLFSCGTQTLSCGMQGLVPQTGIEPRLPALGVWSLTHWPTREVPSSFLFIPFILLIG